MATRTRTHIEGDLKAAEREVERLQAELAAVQPTTLKLSYLDDKREGYSFESDTRTIWYYPSAVSSAPYICRSFSVAQFEQLRDWLVYHYPKGAS